MENFAWANGSERSLIRLPLASVQAREQRSLFHRHHSNNSITLTISIIYLQSTKNIGRSTDIVGSSRVKEGQKIVIYDCLVGSDGYLIGIFREREEVLGTRIQTYE